MMRHAPCQQASTSGVHGFDVKPTTGGMSLLLPASACSSMQALVHGLCLQIYIGMHEQHSNDYFTLSCACSKRLAAEAA